MRLIVWMSEPAALCNLLPSDVVIVQSARELHTAVGNDASALCFVDAEVLTALGEPRCHVVALYDGPLPAAIALLAKHQWLSHLISRSMVSHSLGAEHMRNVLDMFRGENQRLSTWIASLGGRRVRLAQASKRAERLERMTEYLEERGVGGRTIQQLRDSAEELLTNAFYDAPVAAGAAKKAISRTQDVTLPASYACDLVYASRDDLAAVRVRDPFGSLGRPRLVAVLERCARMDMQVEVDESMGGAGLGLWRIFSQATFVAISVVHGRHTEFLVGIGKRTRTPRPFAFHMFLQESDQPRFWKLLNEQSTDPTLGRSISMVTST